MTSDKSRVSGRPKITSYDSGYEHSAERIVDVRRMVENTGPETAMFTAAPAAEQELPKAFAAKAS